MEAVSRESPFPMISVEEAQHIILEQAHQVEKETETIELNGPEDFYNLTGRVLSDDIRSTEPFPPFPASTRDGYALVQKEATAESVEGDFEVVGTIFAGCDVRQISSLAPNQVYKIMTGAPVPFCCNSIVMVEDTKVLEWEGTIEKKVQIKIQPGRRKGYVEDFQEEGKGEGVFIRPIGSDLGVDQVVLQKGEQLKAAEVGLIATIGVKSVKVFRRVSVAVLSTGDELVEPHEATEGGQIRDSNRSMLMSCLSEFGSIVSAVDGGIAKDTADDLDAKLQAALDRADVLITSGGVSMGEVDLLKGYLETKGKVLVGRINMKPGKPLTFATLQHNGRTKLIFATPGNPVSSLVTTHLFALPALRVLAGLKEGLARPVIVRLEHRVRLDRQRPEYYRATVRWDSVEGCLVASGTGNQASSRLASMRSANALLILPAGEGFLEANTHVSSILLSSFVHVSF